MSSYVINKDYPAKPISYDGTRPAQNIKWIVIHGTGNTTDKDINNAKYFSASGGNTRYAGAHYFVDDADNVIYQSIDDLKNANAVGGGRVSNAYGAASKFRLCTNYNSISIEMCSVNGEYQEKTLELVLELTRDLMFKYGIDIDHVIRHWDVTGKKCPGWNGWTGVDQSKWHAFKYRLADLVAATWKALAEINEQNQKNQPAPVEKKTECAQAPSNEKAKVTYQVRIKSGKLYGTVVDDTDYAGWDNVLLSDLAVKPSKGKIMYRVHVMKEKINGKTYPAKWLGWIDTFNWNDSIYGYAGIDGRTIDAVQAKGEGLGGSLMYRVSTTGTPGYLPTVKEDSDYAGIFGKPVDKIQFWVE